MATTAQNRAGASPRRKLSIFDSTCIIVGIIIGAGIFETPPTVAACMGSSPATLGIWLIGGVLALSGALAYAELAAAFPLAGGDYVYQTRAYGRWAGYLFGWSQLAIVRPGDIALMAFVFARYAGRLCGSADFAQPVYAAAAIGVLTTLNAVGLRQGKLTQNVLTVVKAAGLLAIIGAAFLIPSHSHPPSADVAGIPRNPGLALILVLFTFGGWNEMAYVAAEVKRPERNIVRALAAGALTVTVLYALVNAAYLHVLGFEGVAGSRAVAADSLAAALPGAADRAISALICVSALGAVNGLILTGSRISYALGSEHRSFGWLGRWDARGGTPVRSLLVQAGLSMFIALALGSFIDTVLYSAPVVWLFFLATGVSVFVLRRRFPDATRPYRVSGHPVTTLIFCAGCLFMVCNSVSYALKHKTTAFLIMAAIALAGPLVYLLTEARRSPSSRGGETPAT